MSIYDNLTPIDLDKIHTYELASRPSKVTVDNFAAPIAEGDSLRDFLGKLPDILAVQSLRALAGQIRKAKGLGKPIIWGFGGQDRKSTRLNSSHRL